MSPHERQLTVHPDKRLACNHEFMAGKKAALYEISAADRKAIGNRIGAEISKLGRGSKALIAREMGVTPSAIGKIIRTGSMSVDALMFLSSRLKCSTDFLLYGTLRLYPKAQPEFMEELKALMRRAGA